jgi:branched-chain amino acid transport system permease protein
MKKIANFSIAGALLVIAVLFPLITQSNYLISVACFALTFVVIAQSLNMVYGFAGFFALGITVPWVIGGYATAILTKTYDWESAPAILAGGVIAALLMAVVGWISMSRGRDTFSILSLVLMLFVEILVRSWTELTGGGAGIANLPIITIGSLKISNPTQFYYATLVLTAVILGVIWVLLSSRWGRTLRATNTDELLAASLGVNLLGNRVLVFTIASLFCGLIGGVHVLRLAVAVPSMASFTYLAPLLAIIFVGGPGRFFGIIVAGIAVMFAPELLREFDDWRQVFYGGLLIVLCLVFPAGVPARFVALYHSIRKRRASAQNSLEPTGELA